MFVNIDVREQQGMDFFTGESIVEYGLYIGQTRRFKVKCLDVFVS